MKKFLISLILLPTLGFSLIENNEVEKYDIAEVLIWRDIYGNIYIETESHYYIVGFLNHSNLCPCEDHQH